MTSNHFSAFIDPYPSSVTPLVKISDTHTAHAHCSVFYRTFDQVSFLLPSAIEKCVKLFFSSFLLFPWMSKQTVVVTVVAEVLKTLGWWLEAQDLIPSNAKLPLLGPCVRPLTLSAPGCRIMADPRLPKKEFQCDVTYVTKIKAALLKTPQQTDTSVSNEGSLITRIKMIIN